MSDDLFSQLFSNQVPAAKEKKDSNSDILNSLFEIDLPHLKRGRLRSRKAKMRTKSMSTSPRYIKTSQRPPSLNRNSIIQAKYNIYRTSLPHHNQLKQALPSLWRECNRGSKASTCPQLWISSQRRKISQRKPNLQFKRNRLSKQSHRK